MERGQRPTDAAARGGSCKGLPAERAVVGRVAMAAAEAVTVAAAKVAAEKAVAVREVQLGLVGESWILELNKNVRDGRLPRLGVAAGGSHGGRRAPASSRGGWATRQTRQSEKSEFPSIRGPKDKNRGEFLGHGVEYNL